MYDHFLFVYIYTYLVTQNTTYAFLSLEQFSNIRHAFSRKVYFLSKTTCCCQISCLCLFLKTPNRRETQFHAWGWSKFVLSSHLDPIGDQNDV